jgi:hypothetical protein
MSAATPLIARWEHLGSLLKSAKSNCTVFSPFFSREGLKLIDASVRSSVSVTMWTRLSLREWASGVTDPPALQSLLDRLKNTKRPVKLFANQLLHAKAYFADNATGLVGSANLTKGGFDNNVELIVRIEGATASNALSLLTTASATRASSLTQQELAKWIHENASRVAHARKAIEKEYTDLHGGPVKGGDVIKPASIEEPTQALLEDFVRWLANNQSLEGASHLVKLHHDRVVQRQQGHVKQCFAAVFRFLQANPSWIQRLSADAAKADGIMTPSKDLLQDWTVHLKGNRTASSELYKYSTLIAELPPSQGGTHGTGGGAGTTLKRIFPLVARFLSERASQFIEQADII